MTLGSSAPAAGWPRTSGSPRLRTRRHETAPDLVVSHQRKHVRALDTARCARHDRVTGPFRPYRTRFDRKFTTEGGDTE
jgi:hypothetical protein